MTDLLARIARRPVPRPLSRLSRLHWLALAVLSGCAHSQPPPRAESDGPSREEVQDTMRKLTPAIARCVPDSKRSLQVKLGLDGQEGVVVRADLLPDTQTVCTGSLAECVGQDESESAIDLTVLECVRHATLGKPAPHFKASGFNLTCPVQRASEPKSNQL